MKLIAIGEKNEEYFDALINRYYDAGNEERFYVGVLDDKGSAAAAAAFDKSGDILVLRYISVVNNKRRNGIGSFILKQMKERAAAAGYYAIETDIFAEEGRQDEDAVFLFLRSNGFEPEDLELRRSVYDIKDVWDLKENTEEGEHVMFPEDLSGGEWKELEKIRPDVDITKFTKENNPYGCILFRDSAPVAALALDEAPDGVRVSAILSTGEMQRNMKLLYTVAAERIKKKLPKAKKLYVDTYSKTLMEYEDRLMRGINAEAKERYIGLSMIWEV